ncbi:MAG: membrane protein insertase YidC [Methyloligellaceae bacterium]
MDENNKNFILAIVLSFAVLLGWYYFIIGPQQEKAQRQKQAQLEQAKKAAVNNKAGTPQVPSSNGQRTPTAGANIQRPTAPEKKVNRADAISASPRVKIETPSLTGSIALKGARIDDLILSKYKETVKKDSENVVLLSPSASPNPYYAEHGWAGEQGLKLPDAQTLWQVEGNNVLSEKAPVTLVYDNGAGLIFKRIISIDANYLFTIKQTVENKTGKAVVLYPWAVVSRHNKPQTTNFFVLHEGLVGVMGDTGLIEVTYDNAVSEKEQTYTVQNEVDGEKGKAGGWLGITDKYWATVVIPDQKLSYKARFYGSKTGTSENYQTDYTAQEGIRIEPGKTADTVAQVYAGAKDTHLINKYMDQHSIKNFGLMIDWGWFPFLTKPLFYALDYFNKIFNNFGLSILFVTVLIKLVMFPLANKSYESMSKMKKLQPEMKRIKERYKDDAMRQQKEMMEMYKKEKINPMLGCLPVLVQIPVFFALYKVLFITIDMRHAPFYGWISDLSAPDPTNIFNLLGLLPFDPPFPFQVGIWAIIMGLTMWIQMKLNPQQADPMQQAIFNWMPVIFTFMLATFPAGLVIYWAWNNFLSIIQQRYIMKKNGVDVNLIENTGLDKLWSLLKKNASTKKT